MIDRMLTATEVTRLMSVNQKTLKEWAKQGLLPSYRVNARGDFRFKEEDVKRFIEEHKVSQK